MFGSKHQILEMPQIPRDRKALQGALGEARYQRRRKTMMTWATMAIIGLALLLLAWRFVLAGEPAPAAEPLQPAPPAVVLPDNGNDDAIFLPLIIR
jgi:predicted anti-sigma-YlaC factor YlaD